jgi:hypothetical protein
MVGDRGETTNLFPRQICQSINLYLCSGNRGSVTPSEVAVGHDDFHAQETVSRNIPQYAQIPAIPATSTKMTCAFSYMSLMFLVLDHDTSHPGFCPHACVLH